MSTVPRPRRRQPRRRSNRRGSQFDRLFGLKYIFTEAHHGAIKAGTEIQVKIPSDLPKYRSWRLLKVVVWCSSSVPMGARLELYGRRGTGFSPVVSSGSMLVTTTKTRIQCTWPKGQDNYTDEDRNNTSLILWGLGALCVGKQADSLLVYSTKTYYLYGEERESEVCSTLLDGPGFDNEVESLGSSLQSLSV